MVEERPRRRLAAILAADVVGFSRLMEADEAGTLSALKSRRKDILVPLAVRHDGRLFKVTGDGVLVEFASAVNAMQCAVDLQHAMAKANTDVALHRHIVLRIGINLGDVMVEGTDLYGDGVNIAARLEALAQPGGILVSGTAYDQIGTKVQVAFEEVGLQTLKNIATPVRVYQVVAASTMPSLHRKIPVDRPSIAVLPFTNMSGDPQQDYFSDGITEDIITELSRFRSLFVIARHSAFVFKGKSLKVQEIAHELGVGYVVEGSIRRQGDRLRVTAQLIEAASGNHIWAERYDRDARDLFDVQDELARSIAATLGGRVDTAARERAVRLSPGRLEAYDLHLRAKSHFLRYTKSDNEQARLIVQTALGLDPNNAVLAAYSALYHYTNYIFDWADDLDQAVRAGLDLAKRAVALDDADAMARSILAVLQFCVGRFAEARANLEKAQELNPSDMEVRALYGWFLACAGEPDRAIEQFDIVKRHNPFDIVYLPWIRGQAYFVARRYDLAIAHFSQAQDSINEVNAWLAAAHALAGHVDEAKAKMEQFLAAAERDMTHFPGHRREEWMKYVQRSFPYEHARDMEHLCEGLRRAGLPI